MLRLLVFVLLIFITCSTRQQNTIAWRNFIVHEKIKLPLGHDVTANTLSLNSFPLYRPTFLFYLHRGLNKASVFNLHTGELIKKISWESDGPNGIGYNTEFGYMHSFDSIFLISLLEQKIFFTDTTASVKKVYNIGLQITRPKGTYVHQLPGSSPSLSDSSLYLWSMKSFWDDFSSARGVIRYNLINQKAEEVFPYPSIYQKYWWDHYHTLSGSTALPGKNNKVVWFSLDPYLYLLDDNNKPVKQIYAGSDKLNPVAIRKKRKEVFQSEDYENYIKHIFKTGWYAQAYFDPYRNSYYRLGFYGSNKEYADPNQIFSNPFVVIVDNSNLNKIAEQTLDASVHNPLFSFVGPNGFYVLNKKDKLNDEEFLHFDVFRIQ
ncbi:MAG: hypothetical protein KatS3mg032_2091 [Cyclobacteriaceae bacterium]|nr:MAG: hypothetical protein KatS3mg032_2091 [Cyclobacteriaceae bacterium]